jgi:hypothetical protein
VIVRVLGEGQYDVPDGHAESLNEYDRLLTEALDAGDEPAFRRALLALIASVRASGTRLADDALVPSDVVLPGDDATIDDVRELLGDEGLVPGM